VGTSKTCTVCSKSEPDVTFQRGRKQCQDCRKSYIRREFFDKGYYRQYYRDNKAECNRKGVEINRQRRHDRYAEIQALKSKPCMDCGKSFPYYVMDFDHRDRSTKSRDVSALVKNMVRWETVLEEIEKCDLVCACCHRKRTYHGDTNYRSRRYRQHRSILDELKSSNPCLDCGGTFDPCQMDFDHINDKVANIARLVPEPTEVLLAELGKCHLVCANCHRARGATGVRPHAPEHSLNLAGSFQQIMARTPFPEDARFTEFPWASKVGTMVDRELAEQVGVSEDMVGWVRRKLRIPSFKSRMQMENSV
jgi:hypothetical protein